MATLLFHTHLNVDGPAFQEDKHVEGTSHLICQPRHLLENRFIDTRWCYKPGKGMPKCFNLSSVAKCMIGCLFREMRRYAQEEFLSLKHQAVLAMMKKCSDSMLTTDFVAFDRIVKGLWFDWNDNSYLIVTWNKIVQYLPLLYQNIECNKKIVQGTLWHDKSLAHTVHLFYDVSLKKEFVFGVHVREFMDDGEEWLPYIFCETKISSGSEEHPFGLVTIKTGNIPPGFFSKPPSVTRGEADAIILMRSGDIESNPGPTCHSKPLAEQIELTADEQIKEIQKQTAKLEKKIREFKNMSLDKRKLKKQHEAFLQRNLEKEKIKRKRNRKAQAAAKIPKEEHDEFEERYAQGLLNFTNNIGNTAQVVSDKIGPAMDSMQQVLDALTGATEEIRKFFELGDDIDFINILVDLVTICKCVVSGEKILLAMHMFNLSRHLGITMSDIMNLFPKVEDETVAYESTSENDRTGQSLIVDMLGTAASRVDLLPITGTLTFIVGIFSLMMQGTVPSSAEMLKHFGIVGRAAMGFACAKSVVDWVITYLCEIYYSTVYGMSLEEYKFATKTPEIGKLYAAATLIRSIKKEQIDVSRDIADQILSVYSRLQLLHSEALKLRTETNVRLLASLITSLRDHTKWATNSPARVNKTREPPFGLYLYGEPGVGKSVLNDVLRAKIYKEWILDTGVSYDNCYFPRKSVNDHWEGYNNQPILELDDFGNQIDSPNNPVREYCEIISMCNIASYPLHMAAIEGKGTSFFNSEYVHASTNNPYPEIKSLNEPSAVFRRFQMYAKVTIRPEYGTLTGIDSKGQPYYKFNKEVAAKHLGVEPEKLHPLMTDHYQISLYELFVNKTISASVPQVHPIANKQNLTMDEFWEEYKTTMLAYKKSARELTKAIKDLAGIPDHPPAEPEKETLKAFAEIFNRDELVFNMAKTMSKEEIHDVVHTRRTGQSDTRKVDDETAKEELEVISDEEEEINEDNFEDSILNVFGSFKDASQLKVVTTYLREEFDKNQEKFVSMAKAAYESMKGGYTKVKNKLFKLGEMLFSLLASMTGKVQECIFKIPVCAPFVAIGGVLSVFLYSYVKKFIKPRTRNCKFSEEPTEGDSPCRECKLCQIIDYPSTGNAIEHFLQRCGVRQVVNELVDAGIDREELGLYVNALWIKRFQRVSEENQRLMMREYESYKFAERVYDNEPRKAKHVAVAQKIYDDKPIQSRGARYAHGAVECKTQMSLGSTLYAQGDFVQVEQATQTLMHNSVWLQCVDEDGLASRSNGCFLVGRTLVTTAHTVLSPPGKSKFSYIAIYNPYQERPTIKVPYEACNISQMKQKDGELVDLAMISFPPVVASRRRITSRFIDSNQFERCTEGELVFTAFSEIGGKIGIVEKYPSKFATSSRATHYLLHQPGTCPKDPKMCQCPIKISNHITYDIDTKNGMCGALLTVKNNAVSSKLIGFHTAGGKAVSGMGVFTSKQFIEFNLDAHIKLFNIPDSYLIDGRLPYSQSLVDSSKKVSYVHEGDCLSVGVAQPPLLPVKSQIKPSLIHNEVLKTKMAPALLTAKVVKDGNGDEVLLDPMTKGLQKLMGQQVWIPREFLDEAINDVFNGIGYKSNTQVHSYEEAIKGVEGNPLKQPIKRNTSPGYPYNLNNKMKGKTAWLGTDENYIIDNPELKADVENLIAKAKSCVRGDAISMATLKDEKRPLEKVLIGKTRVFEACPQHLVIAIRQYFLDFVAHIMEHRIDNGIAVGINPYSLEWTKVADHLHYMGDNMVAGDFSNFDGSLLMQVLVRICEKINDWYGDGEENAKIRMTLWEHICNADVIIGREIIRQTHSQPSGNPLTVIINSLFNAIIMRVAYLKLKKEQGLPVVCDYRSYVREIIYGDDDIKSINIAILNWFNQETITKALAEYGLTYTDETKKNNTTALAKSLKEVSFLKRKFVRDSCCNYIAPMEIDNILEITNWVKGNNVREDTKENCKHVFVELALHEEHIYDHWVRIITVKCQEKGLKLFPPTWKAQRTLYLYNPDNNAFYNPFF